MKKITTLMLSIAFIGTMASAQNLVTNPGFEADIATFTVVEGTTDVLMRVNAIQDATTQTAAPTATAIPVADGMWVKKAPNTGYVKHIVTDTDKYSGLRCVNLKINANYTSTGMTSWWNSITTQKIVGGLSNTKKYKASVWAKIDESSPNAASNLYLYVTDNTAKVNITKTIALTGGTTWTKYETTFDIPTHISANPTANFATAFFGAGITTTYTDGKTNYAGVMVDDFSLEEDNTTTSITEQDAINNCFTLAGDKLLTSEAGMLRVYSYTGAKLKEINVQNGQSVSLEKGGCIVQFINNNKKYSQRIIVN